MSWVLKRTVQWGGSFEHLRHMMFKLLALTIITFLGSNEKSQ